MSNATLFFLTGVLLAACAEVRIDADSNTEPFDTHGPTDSEFGGNTDGDTNTGTQTDTDTDTGSGPDMGTGSDTGTGTGSGSDTGTGTGSGSDTGTGTGSDTDMGSDTGTGSGSDTGPGSDMGTGQDTDSAPHIEVSFSERIDSYEYLVDKGAHRLLIGPSTSNNPEDGSWVVLRNEEQMRNKDANQAWAAVGLDAGPVVKANAWTSFRLAFHYDGTSADNWWIDDVCVGTAIDPCGYFEQAFSAVQAGALPYEWRQIKGLDNVSLSDAWQVDYKTGTSDRAVAIMWSADRLSRYLVTRTIYIF
jgi:hypothetical protein